MKKPVCIVIGRNHTEVAAYIVLRRKKGNFPKPDNIVRVTSSNDINLLDNVSNPIAYVVGDYASGFTYDGLLALDNKLRQIDATVKRVTAPKVL